MTPPEAAGIRKIVLVGNPNVGKSVIFRLLTGSYVLVSNFPGTTVDISRGRMKLGDADCEIVDTPGVYSLVPQSEDERVTCEILLREKPDIVIQVADAKNLRRTLLITSQLAELGFPAVLALNMMDEAQERGVQIDAQGLRDLLGIPVVETVAIYSQGRRQLLQALGSAARPRNRLPEHFSENLAQELSGLPADLPAALAAEWLALDNPALTEVFEEAYGREAIAQLDAAHHSLMRARRRSLAKELAAARNSFLDDAVERHRQKRPVHFLDESAGKQSRFWLACLAAGAVLFCWNMAGAVLGAWTPHSFLVERLVAFLTERPEWMASGSIPRLARAVLFGDPATAGGEFGLVFELLHFLMFLAPVVIPFGFLLARSRAFAEEMGIQTRRAVTGIPILIGVLLLVYEFVGYTGAQTLVGLLEEVLFGQFLVPWLQAVIPPGLAYDFLAGKYGLISMGLTYAIAIVFPVVGTFFIAFSLLEDSGYLPRLSILSDRVMRLMGLNGKATLPMVLGLGCCTMATITTRVLNSRKERLIATLLLALGIPCSAQLGVILGISARFSGFATATVIGVVLSQLLLVGYLASRLLRGPRSEFIFEIPPIRAPQMRNVMLKTGYRLQWYIKEAVPLFLIGTTALFFLDKVAVRGRSLLLWLEAALEPVLEGILHVPAQAASVFVLGFLRRDYGAAGLFDMVRNNLLTGQQAVVSMIVITLFVPCVASFLVIIKEQGVKRAMMITGFILPFALMVGGAVAWIFRALEINFI